MGAAGCRRNVPGVPERVAVLHCYLVDKPAAWNELGDADIVALFAELVGFGNEGGTHRRRPVRRRRDRYAVPGSRPFRVALEIDNEVEEIRRAHLEVSFLDDNHCRPPAHW